MTSEILLHLPALVISSIPTGKSMLTIKSTLSSVSANMVDVINDRISLTHAPVSQIYPLCHCCALQQEGGVRICFYPSESNLWPCPLTQLPCFILCSWLLCVCFCNFFEICVLECSNNLMLRFHNLMTLEISWKISPSDMWRCVDCVTINVSEENIAPVWKESAS
jgi:hypothetical protein